MLLVISIILKHYFTFLLSSISFPLASFDTSAYVTFFERTDGMLAKLTIVDGIWLEVDNGLYEMLTLVEIRWRSHTDRSVLIFFKQLHDFLRHGFGFFPSGKTVAEIIKVIINGGISPYAVVYAS